MPTFVGISITFDTMTENDNVIAFEALYKKIYPRLYYYARGIVGETDADDIVSEAFMDLWRRRDEIDFGDRIGALLSRSVYTRSINCLKHRNMSLSRIALLEELSARKREIFDTDNNSSPQKRLENADLHTRLDVAIGQLPERCRVVFCLSYLHDMRNDKIAELLGLSVRTVEAHIYNALRTLRQRLDNE